MFAGCSYFELYPDVNKLVCHLRSTHFAQPLAKVSFIFITKYVN